MGSGGWFLVDDILDKANRRVFAYYRRARSPMKIPEMARIASDGTEDLSTMRWQFSVLIKKRVRLGTTLWARIVEVFGVRAVVGHTAVPLSRGRPPSGDGRKRPKRDLRVRCT